jgi:hypothetical protein
MSGGDLESRIREVGRVLPLLARRLDELGYQFDEPERVLPGPQRITDAVIARIEREIGAVPLALNLFWRHVGSVNLMGQHPDWVANGYPDPLVIESPSFAIEELDEFLEDREEREKCGSRFVIPIAPDDYHKANVSGGMFYNISVPAVADDPPLNDERRHRTTFVKYLEIALSYGGFPGLVRCDPHDFPLDQILAGLQ